MQNITESTRRATRDIDLDFIHYPLDETSIRTFISSLNRIEGIKLYISGSIEELKHQDYHGKRATVNIEDTSGKTITCKIDIGVHKHLEIEQDKYCFDVCMDDRGASLLKNTVEQAFAEKLLSLLIFGTNSRRYKDVFDMYYLKDIVDRKKCKRQLIS